MKNPPIRRYSYCKCPFRILLAATALTLAFRLDAQVTEPGSPAPEAEKVKSVDDRVMSAWQNGDANELGSIVGDKIIGIFGAKDQQFSREAFLKRAARGGMSKSEMLAGRSVRIFGASGDVAIVDGYVKAGSEAQKPNGSYYAVYAKKGADWNLVCYTYSRQQVGGGAGSGVGGNIYGLSAIPAGATGSVASLTPDERMVVERMRLLMDNLARRKFKQMAAVMDKEAIYGHVPLGATPKSNRDSYIASKFPDPAAAAPEIIGLLNPHVIICGANRDVAVLDLIRADSAGGGLLGSEWEPHWRAVSNQLSVWIRTSPSTLDWRAVQVVGAASYAVGGGEMPVGSGSKDNSEALAAAISANPAESGSILSRAVRANGDHAAAITKAAITAAPADAVTILSTIVAEAPAQRGPVTAAAISADPGDAAALTGAACRTALSGTSTPGEDDRAIATVVAAAVSSAPSQAGPMAAAGVTGAPGQVGPVVAAAITASPDQAVQITRAAIAASPTQAADMVQAAIAAAPNQAAALQQAAVEAAPGQSAEIAKAAAAAPSASVQAALSVAAQYSPNAAGKSAQ